MSGIIGSKFNVRGSGLVGSLGTDGQHMLSAGAGKTNVFETVAAPAATDLTPVRQDLLLLGLKQAIQENSTKFNLANSAITKFEADADFNLAGSTTIKRNTSEYIESVASSSGSTDSDTTFLLHSDTTDGSTSFTDSSASPVSIVAVGNVHHETDQQKFGDSSIHFDGTGDYLSPADHADLNPGTGNWTVDYWVRPTAFDSDDNFHFGGSNLVTAEHNFGTFGTSPQWRTGNTYANTFGTAPVMLVDTWYHLLWERTGTDLKIWKDGVLQNTVSSYTAWQADIPDFHIGRTGNTAIATQEEYKGYMDEFRFSKGVVRTSESDDACYSSDGTTFANGVPTMAYPVDTYALSATGTALGTTNVPTSAVTEVSGVMLLKNAVGTNTLGTDVKVYFTADNSAFTECTYTDAGTFSTGIKMIKLGKTTVTSGSDVRWKIVFANQSGSKTAYIYGIGLNY